MRAQVIIFVSYGYKYWGLSDYFCFLNFTFTVNKEPRQENKSLQQELS